MAHGHSGASSEGRQGMNLAAVSLGDVWRSRKEPRAAANHARQARWQPFHSPILAKIDFQILADANEPASGRQDVPARPQPKTGDRQKRSAAMRKSTAG